MFQKNNTPWHFIVKQGKRGRKKRRRRKKVKKSCAMDYGDYAWKIINFLNIFSGLSKYNFFPEITVGYSAGELLFPVIGSGQKPC